MYSTSSDRCFGSRNSCPSSSVTSCNHYNDVSIVCSKYTPTQVTEIFWAYILHFCVITTNFHVYDFNFASAVYGQLTHPPTVSK